jgi:hypothetical protein
MSCQWKNDPFLRDPSPEALKNLEKDYRKLADSTIEGNASSNSNGPL